MAEQMEYWETPEGQMAEKITHKIDRRDSSSSSDSDAEKLNTPSPAKAKIYRMFGRERPVHKVLGGGNLADVLLWREKKVSAIIVGTVTFIWFLFELVGYHLLTFVCHALMVALALAFVWSNAISKSPEHIPDIHLPEEPFILVASRLREEFNCASAVLRDIASGRDLKKFLTVTAALWILSAVGNWFNFLTLIYICFVLLHTLPVVYEKYEDEIDPLAEKAMIEIKKQYEVLDAKFLSKLPISFLKAKRF